LTPARRAKMRRLAQREYERARLQSGLGMIVAILLYGGLVEVFLR
jgi:hypothetical protein